jgi:hypothetical protein
MGLLHFVQIGGGVFFGMMLTLVKARVLPNSLSPETAEAGAVMGGLSSALCSERDLSKTGSIQAIAQSTDGRISLASPLCYR